jgi:hypothetical protein
MAPSDFLNGIWKYESPSFIKVLITLILSYSSECYIIVSQMQRHIAGKTQSTSTVMVKRLCCRSSYSKMSLHTYTQLIILDVQKYHIRKTKSEV